MPDLRLTIASALLLAGVARAEADYLKDIKPVLKARCYACHGALKQKSGLRLDTVASMRKGGADGDILAAPAALLVSRLTHSDEHERMPPEGAPLSAEEIGKIKEWIAAGAKPPPDEQLEPDPRAHWAYRSPKRANGDIDSLLAARLKANGLTSQPEAAPEIWLRRVYIDLIGIPPTPDQIREFQRAATGDIGALRTQTVDKLLSSPQYGERWGRHFMDIWRYCDWYGLDAQLRNSQKHIWHWRDWIIESLNAGKGYDRMIVEMLAADEETPADRDALRATGFLCRNYYLFNRTTWLDDTVEHTSRGLLGVTMQCTKCHDHKYDPLEHADYYRMRAVFEPYHVRLDPWPGETDFEKNGLPRAYDLHLEKATYRHIRGDDKNEDKAHPIAPGVPAVLAFGDFKPASVALPPSASAPGIQQFVLDDQLKVAERSIVQSKESLAKARSALTPLQGKQSGALASVIIAAARSKAEADVAVSEKTVAAAAAKPAMLGAAFAADQARALSRASGFSPAWLAQEMGAAAIAAKSEADHKLAETEVELAKAQLARLSAPKKDEADKKIKAAETALTAAKKRAEKPGTAYTSFRATFKAQEGPEEKANADVQQYPATSTGRRLAFARWIADARNPLTARVLVNHVWLRHFGASLVPDVTDFGLRCQAPLHQDILDTLAADFMEHGWSIKRLHRQMVLSRLYRISSSNAHADAATLSADLDNAHYWRMNPRRVESQAVRDALLFVAGKLDLQMGGPSIDAKNEASPRRSLYFVQSANDEHRFLGTLDNANVLECYRRQESVVPQQALALTNSKLTRECADAFAARTAKLEEAAFIEESFLALLGRAPTKDESRACSENLSTLSKLQNAKSDTQRARALFVQALMSHNDFVTLR